MLFFFFFFLFFFYTLLSKIIVTSGKVLLDMFHIPIVTTGGGFESWMSMLETPRGINQLSYKTLGNWTFSFHHVMLSNIKWW